ncbi:hypothetical protein IW261DRAFT_1425022 [Armillaria novae-zelandiae]|uniref:Uncharacterized protein n=1 Tax=Armillaria novae-zelandiae TaxID=153914 RepID=A0AA39UAI1_9AGAR|nr:hypothetical protein IW261DRAFT_1425022 [Armillaria novae-zelandiae]
MADKVSAENDSRPSLPQELIDHTLDFLHDDVPALRVYSLASHGLLPRSRHHIYSGVFIIHDIDLDSFKELYAGLLLRTLRSMRLTTVHLKGIAYKTYADFEDVFTAVANPALKHLSIDSESEKMTSSNLPLSIRRPANGLPELESLSMSGDALSLELGSDTKKWVMQAVLDEMRDTLECLTLDIAPNGPGGNIGVDLRQHKKLKSFLVVLSFAMKTGFLKTTTFGAALQTLTVELHYNDWAPTDPSLAEVDAHINGLALPMLRHVHIKLHNNGGGDCHSFWCDGGYLPHDQDTWKNQVKDGAPLI